MLAEWIIRAEFGLCQIPQRSNHTSGASGNKANTMTYKTYHIKPKGAY